MGAWTSRVQGLRAHARHVTLVFVDDSLERMRGAAAAAASAGFLRAALLDGGLHAFAEAAHAKVNYRAWLDRMYNLACKCQF